MSVDHLHERKSIERLTFDHFLRTGQRLTSGQWLARCERKFNPYHDAQGRFTSPPGVTVSWGRNRAAGEQPPAKPGGPSRSRDAAAASKLPTRATPPAQSPRAQQNDPGGDGSSAGSLTGFRSELVRKAVSPASHAETYFELNKRQAQLDQLRADAGANPDPVTKADLDEIQRRFDADRARLDARVRIIDRETVELLRAGLAPADVAAGAIWIAADEAELRDYLAVAGVFPLGGTIGKIGKVGAKIFEPAEHVVQLGGKYGVVRKLRGFHAHHIPADSISPLPRGQGPTIAMSAADHRLTKSFGRGPAASAHRQAQKELIDSGDFPGAQELDIADIRQKFGNKYDGAIEQMLKYTRDMGL